MSSAPSDAKPFLQWVGGKRYLLPHVLRAMPSSMRTYGEFFLGGGAVFLELANRGAFERALISDTNRDLVWAWMALRRMPERVIDAIYKIGVDEIDRQKYYRMRRASPWRVEDIAARTLFLNATCFNGKWSVNSKGKFNSGWNKDTSWKPNVDNLRAVAHLLQRLQLTISVMDVGRAALDALVGMFGEGDVVYLDPPYLPRGRENAINYTQRGYGVVDHVYLAGLFARLAARGVHVVASNSSVRAVELLYGGIPGTEIYEVDAFHTFARKGHTTEYLIVNPGK